MPSVGQQIRQQRLHLGLELEDISAQTRIPSAALHAIESDDLTGISSPFLYKSFVRQVAECLKMEAVSLAPAMESAVASMPQPRMPGEGEIRRSLVPPLRVRSRTKIRWLIPVFTFALVLFACSSVYGVWQSSKFTWRSQLGSLLRAKPQTSPPSPQVRVELSALERTWLSIAEDGKQTFTGVLDPDQTKVLEGHDTARIRTENAGGISCVFNGKPIGPLGERGQARIVVFTKTNYKVVDPAPRMAWLRIPIYR